MIYDIKYNTMRQKLLNDAKLEGDDCPVDDICDSIEKIIDYVKYLESQIREYKNVNMKLVSDIKDYERKINNLKGQKFRIMKKKNKDSHR